MQTFVRFPYGPACGSKEMIELGIFGGKACLDSQDSVFNMMTRFPAHK